MKSLGDIMKSPGDIMKSPGDIMKSPGDNMKSPSDIMKSPDGHFTYFSFTKPNAQINIITTRCEVRKTVSLMDSQTNESQNRS